MTRPGFDPKRPETWDITLTLDEVAAIYGRSADSIAHTLTPKSRRVAFQPSPIPGRKPYRWRRTDIERDVLGPRVVGLARRA